MHARRQFEPRRAHLDVDTTLKGCSPVVMNVVFLEVKNFLKNSARQVVHADVGAGAKEGCSEDVVKDVVRVVPDKKFEVLDGCRQKKHTKCRRKKAWLTIER